MAAWLAGLASDLFFRTILFVGVLPEIPEQFLDFLARMIVGPAASQIEGMSD